MIIWFLHCTGHISRAREHPWPEAVVLDKAEGQRTFITRNCWFRLISFGNQNGSPPRMWQLPGMEKRHIHVGITHAVRDSFRCHGCSAPSVVRRSFWEQMLVSLSLATAILILVVNLTHLVKRTPR